MSCDAQGVQQQDRRTSDAGRVRYLANYAVLMVRKFIGVKVQGLSCGHEADQQQTENEYPTPF